MKIIYGNNEIFRIAIHLRGSRSSIATNSLGVKFDMIFIIISLKTETCSLATRLLSEDSQSNRLMAFLYDRNFPEKNTTQLFHKEEGKQPLNRILHKFFDDEN